MKRLLLAIALVCCKSGDEPAPIPACGYASPVAACTSCAQTSCCDALGACEGDPDCRGYVGCVAGCRNDPECTTKCRQARPKGVLRSAAVDSCLAARCSRACGLACGGYVGPTALCTACVEGKCCSESTACLANADCVELVACERTCSAVDSPCLARCERERPNGITLARALGTCAETSCTTSCLPSHWRCLDAPPPPPVTAARASLTVTLTLNSTIDTKPWPGISVRACRQQDQTCATPVAGPVVTDENGRAALTLPGEQFDGYFEASGGGVMPILLFYGPVRSDLTRGFGVFDKSVFDLFTGPIAEARADRGHLLVTVRDCLYRNAPGVSFDIDPRDEAIVGYLISGLLSTGEKQTGPSGTAGFLNVRPNTGVRILPRIVAFDRALPTMTVFTRPGWVSGVDLQGPSFADHQTTEPRA